MVRVDSRWENYTLTGYVSKPTDARPSRNLQTFFVNGRPVKSRLLIAALEEAYRNQIMTGKFPSCVLHLTVPANVVDVNVHPAKTEVKFLNEKAVFDCIHYGTLGALNKTPDRPQVQFKKQEPAPIPTPEPVKATAPVRQDNFFRTMNTQEYKNLTQALQNAPKPSPLAVAALHSAVERDSRDTLREQIVIPNVPTIPVTPEPAVPIVAQPQITEQSPVQPEAEQIALPIAQEIPWKIIGELYRSYIIVEQGEDAFLIDKHAAHERILFEKLKANQQEISSQALLTPVPCRLSPDACGMILSNQDLLDELGFEIDQFGDNTILLRQIPMDLNPEDAADALESIATDLLNGRREDKSTVRDEVLHTVACKAAIKAGWMTSERELQALVKQVMETCLIHVDWRLWLESNTMYRRPNSLR